VNYYQQQKNLGLSFDSWTSSNNKNFLGLNISFICNKELKEFITIEE